jgi:hypothetical protein
MFTEKFSVCRKVRTCVDFYTRGQLCEESSQNSLAGPKTAGGRCPGTAPLCSGSTVETMYEPITKPCATCDDVYVYFGGDWSHAGTDFDERCPALHPEMEYRAPSDPVRAAATADLAREQAAASS